MAIAAPATIREQPAVVGLYNQDGGGRTHWVATRTESGRILASGSGLIELDGGVWRQLSTEGGFDWESLAADRNARVWAGAKDEIGVYETSPSGLVHYRSLTSLLPETERDLGDIWHAFAREPGVYFVCRERVVWTDGVNARSWHVPAWRRLYAWEDNGAIYVGGRNGQVLRLSPDGPEPVHGPAFGAKYGVSWAENLESGEWLAYADNGLVSASPVRTEALLEVNKLLAGSAPVSYMRLPDGRLAIGTYYKGLFLIDTDSGRFVQLDDRSGLPAHSVTGLVSGGRDWLWAVTSRGLGRVSLSDAVSVIESGAGLDASSIRFVERDGPSVIIATNAGRYILSVGDGGQTFTKLSNSLFQNHARFGDTILCGAMTGLYRMTAEKAERLIEEASDVIAIVPGPKDTDTVFYATQTSIRAARWKDGKLEVVATIGMPRQIESMIADSSGDLWVSAGPAHSRIGFLGEKDGFMLKQEYPQSTHSTPERSSGGEVKLIGIGDSVVALRSGRLMEPDRDTGRLVPVAGLESVEILGAVSGTGSEAWALARPARHRDDPPRLVRLRRDGRTLTAEEIHAPGSLTMGAPASIHFVEKQSGGHELWIGAREGIVRVDPARVAAVRQSPSIEVRMTRSVDEGESAVLPETSSLPFNSGSITLRWASPETLPGDGLFETRLAGAETGWLPAGTQHAREFARLADGAYEFQVRAVDALGRPGPVASRAFTVLPPWYRTPAAITGFCAAALAFGWTGWQMRLRVARRRAEELEDLVDMRTRELARVNAEMTRFIARMNHEIRNPLNGLLGAVGVLEQFPHAGREGRMIQILRACADHLGAVVEDVLDFSNIEGGRIVVQDRAFSVAEMVEAVPRMMIAETDRTGTEVVTTISPDVPAVIVADPDRIRQILVNFLGNALKYAPGEPVHIDVSTMSVEESPWLRFAVRDHGPGISEADKQNLFKMFERGRSPAKRKVRGMGIGLATCRLLARRMGGEVGVISGLGEGSEFFLKLPLKVEAGLAPQPDLLPQAELRGLACLVVEDQEFNRVILRDMLERFGCSVDEAVDAETGLSLAAMNRYNVVFTDLELPDAAPGEILRMLKEQQSAASTPVPALVVTTAYATENVRQTCLGAGATAFLAKPLSSSKLLAVLREIDSARRPAASVETATSEPVRETPAAMIHHLARIRGCSVQDVAAEIAGNLDDEVRQLHAGVRLANSHDVCRRAHRLLSIAAMADTPGLAGVVAGIQSEAQEGRMPAPGRLDALAAAAASTKEKLSSLTSGGSAGAQSRAPGRSEPTASSHSD
jgi:signal transduction histidine kinase/CheY-like chemotaxis protein